MHTFTGLMLSFLFITTVTSLTFSDSFWRPQNSGVTSQFDKVHFANANTGIILEPWGFILRTTNGGVNWTRINTGINGQYAVRFKDANTAYLFGFTNLYKSTNGGVNWTSVMNMGNSASGIFFFGETIIVAGNPLLYKSTNNGLNWSSLPSHSDGYFVNENTGWSITAQYYPPPNPNNNIYNRIYKTTNGGVNWFLQSELTSQVQPMYNMIRFCDESTGYISGLYGTRKSTNGGIAWTVIKPGMSWGVFPVNKDTLWLTEPGSKLYYSVNGGNNWSYDSINTTINDIYFVDKNTAWAVGQNGKIFISSTAFTSLEGLGEISPTEYMLYQNYPNPFNPSTKIKYAVSENNSSIRIEVFDIRGRIVAVLIDKTHSAGVYEVDFNSYNLSTGIYFYRFIADEVVKDAKKMLLVK